MAGDLQAHEELLVVGPVAPGVEGFAASAPAAGDPRQIRPIHRYGRLAVMVSIEEDAPSAGAALAAPPPLPDDLTATEQLGAQALAMRQSADYREAKAARPRAGEKWDMTSCVVGGDAPAQLAPAPRVGAEAGGPTSSYLEGSVAVGIVVVQGPTAELQFSNTELLKVTAEVQNGLGFLATTNPVAGLMFSYDIQNVSLTTPADPGATDLEGLWRDPAMAALGYSASFNGVREYAEALRTRFSTRWTYCAFFTKYPLRHFAYASIGGPRLVMDYANDGWGPENIDRVFAHETGHVFGAPDEYAGSGCSCGGSWGRYGLRNGNCENCAAGGGVPCLMKSNSFEVCGYTPGHFGWGARRLVNNFGYGAGGWRIDQHPRLLADTTGDGRADIVGFGHAGAYRSRALSNGRFSNPQLVIDDFGYGAGGWRVDQHPRFLADTTGDGRADVVGFGNAGVYVSRAQADGTFAAPQLVIHDFGRDAGGWRVDQHPRFLADTTGDGRADVVGFGYAGVYVARAQGDGSFAAPQLVMKDFGYSAGGWRIDRHPRFLADTTGDGRADVVGFGHAGVYVARAQGDGSFAAPQLVIDNFGYGAGGWRIDRHPRFLADTTGDGRADVVGFGNAGVYVSRAQADGTFAAPQLVINNFGHGAGGWRVDQHPRFLADTTGDGRADVVGFGNAGVYISRANADGTFDTPGLVVTTFGASAGGWSIHRHPRMLADTTGNGRADIVGFGDAGVYVAMR